MKLNTNHFQKPTTVRALAEKHGIQRSYVAAKVADVLAEARAAGKTVLKTKVREGLRGPASIAYQVKR